MSIPPTFEELCLAGGYSPEQVGRGLDRLLSDLDPTHEPRRSSEPDIAEPWPGAANKDGFTE